jgi:hypothetical protein
MSLSKELLVAEAERLLARAERKVRRYRSMRDNGAIAQRAELELKRLHLYRAILGSNNCARALMPEYVLARGLVDPNRDDAGSVR